MTGPSPTPPAQPQPEPGAPPTPPPPGASATPPPSGYAVPAGTAPPVYPPRPVYPPAPLAPNGQPLADFFSRLGAYVLDALIMAGIAAVFWLPLFIWWFVSLIDEVTTTRSSTDQAEPDLSEVNVGEFFLAYLLLLAGVLLISLIVSYLYLVEFTWRSGQTLGKRIVKLKIVPADPAAARTRGMLAKRWAVEQLGGAIIPFFSYLDGLWQLWDKPLQQCLHDKAAQTVVVKIG